MVDTKISDYLIGIIIFTMVIVGGISMMTIFQSKNSAFLDTEKFSKFNDTFNTYDDVVQETGSIESSITNSNPDPGLFGVLNGLIQGAWQVLKLMFGSLSFMTAVWTGLYTIFGVPLWVGVLIGSIVIVLIAFAIWSAIFQRET